jgi:hypothetical protein
MAADRRRSWWQKEEAHSRETRGEQGHMEFWLRLARARIAKGNRAGQSDVYAAFALVCRLFMTAMDTRDAGDRRLWEDLLRYAQQVVEQNPPRN